MFSLKKNDTRFAQLNNLKVGVGSCLKIQCTFSIIIHVYTYIQFSNYNEDFKSSVSSAYLLNTSALDQTENWYPAGFKKGQPMKGNTLGQEPQQQESANTHCP